MKILLVNHTFVATDGQGGVNARVAGEMLRRGHRVTLVGGDAPDDIVSHPSAAHVVITPARWAPTRLAKNLSFGSRTARVIRRLRGQHDLVVANGGMTLAASDVNLCHFVHAAWAKSPHHPSRSASGRGQAWRAYQRLYTEKACLWERDAYRRAGVVIAVSELIQQQLVDEVGLDAARVRVIANGVDPPPEPPSKEQRARAREAMGLTDTDFGLLFAGDLKTPRKNFDVLLEAVRRLPNEVKLIAAGEHRGGPYPRLTEERGVASRVRFLGMRDDLRSLYTGADAFALLSHYEPFGLVVGEALTAGVPVITASTVGAAPIVRDANAGFVLDDPNDAAGLAARIDQLLRDRDLLARLGQRAAQAATQLSWQEVGDRYEQVFEQRVRAITAPERRAAVEPEGGAT